MLQWWSPMTGSTLHSKSVQLENTYENHFSICIFQAMAGGIMNRQK